MTADLYEFFLNRPILVRALGWFLWQCGSFALLAGLIANTANAVLAVSTSVVRMSAQADYHLLFPGLPTWWIPESAFAVVACMLLMAVGYALSAVAREWERVLRDL